MERHPDAKPAVLAMTWAEFGKKEKRTVFVSHHLANQRGKFFFQKVKSQRVLHIRPDLPFPSEDERKRHGSYQPPLPKLPHLHPKVSQGAASSAATLPASSSSRTHFPLLPLSPMAPQFPLLPFTSSPASTRPALRLKPLASAHSPSL